MCNDTNGQAGPMKARRDFHLSTKVNENLRQEQGQQNSFIPKNERTRERGKDHSPRNYKQNWNGLINIGDLFSRKSLPPHHLHKIGGNTNIKTLNGVNTKTLDGKITNGKITNGENRVKAEDSLQNRCGSHIARTLRTRRCVSRFLLTGNSDSIVSDGNVDRTPRRTHIFLGLVSLRSVLYLLVPCRRSSHVHRLKAQGPSRLR